MFGLSYKLAPFGFPECSRCAQLVPLQRNETFRSKYLSRSIPTEP